MKSNKAMCAARMKQKLLVTAVAASLSGSALAIEFEMENGWKGSLNTTFSASSAWRVEDRDPALIGARDAIATGLYSDATGITAGCTVGAGLANPAACSAANYNGYWLRAVQAGYRSGAQTDVNNVNYDRGDRYSTQLKVFSELSLHKDGMGGMIRVKGWYDQALKDEGVRMGSPANAYKAGAPLDDSGAKAFNKFDGLELLDAYVYNSFDVADQRLQVRVGRQAVNWGESLFIQGVNQLAPLDITALRKAGTEIKEALLPVWSVYGNMSLPAGMSLEGYYQFKWEGSNIDECGTYFSGSNATLTNKAGNCKFGFPFYRDNPSAFNYGKLAAPAVVSAVNPNDPIGLTLKDGPTPKNGGQWGFALRAPIDAIDTELGLYAMNIHARIPVLTISEGGNLRGTLAPGITAVVTAQAKAAVTTAVTTAVNAAVTAGQLPAANAAAAIAAGVATQMASATVQTQVGTGVKTLLSQLPQTGFSGVGNFLGSLGLGMLATTAESVGKVDGRWEYPEDMKVFGVSASTTLAGWSMGGELSYTKDIPIQRNGNDVIVSAVLGVGPAAAKYQAAMGVGTAKGVEVAGWDKTHKTQLQINAVNTLPGMLGAVGGLFVGEIAAQVSGIQNSDGNNMRYGRAFLYGNAAHSTYSALAGAAALSCVDPASMTAGTTPGTGVSSFFTNSSPTGCANDGFMTHSAWGYRVKASLDYPLIFGTSWTATPSIFWSHDVKGYAVDYQFNEGRKVVSLGLNLSLNKEHNVMLNYTTFANSAKYDSMRDKDNASIAYSYTF